MNIFVIFRSLGILVMLLGLSMGGTLLVSEILPHSRETEAAVNYQGWWVSILTTVLCGGLAYLLGRGMLRKGKKADEEFKVSRREAVAVVGLGWIVCSVFAALPHYFCLESVGWWQALFEACSGLTTTGSSIFPKVEELPAATLCWRSVTQWLGGMGILGAFLLIFSGETKGKTLLSFESSIHGTDLYSTNVRTAMRNLWRIYIGLTVVCLVGLWIMDMSLFQAFNHSLTTTATGGFGTENDSMSSFSDPLKVWVIFFMLVCGISFPLYMVLLQRKNLSVLKSHEETRYYLGLIFLSVLLLLVWRYFEEFNDSVVDVIFNVVSIVTSAGFAAGNYDVWPAVGKQVIMVLMFIGGCSGSTAGGLKVSRILLWLRSLRNEIVKGFRPNIVLRLKMNGKNVSDDVIRSVYVVISLAVFCFVGGTKLLCLLEPEKSTIDIAGAVISALSNIGPAFGEMGPTQSYATLSSPALSALSAMMIIGRLEYIAVLVLFSRRLWKRY